MRRSRKRMLALALALLMTPVFPAWAQAPDPAQVWGCQIVLEGLRAEINGFDPLEVDLRAVAGYAQQEEGPWLVRFSLGEGSGALKGVAGMEDPEGPVRLKLEGLSMALEADLADLFRGGDHAGMEDFLTQQQGIADSLERYFQGMEMLAGDPQAHIQSVKGALTLAAQEGLGQEAGQEPAEIAGRQLQAQRFDFQGETGDFVRVMELAVAEDPRLEQVRQAMVALINGLDGMDYQEMEDYFREVYPQGRIQGSRWDSLDGRGLRLEYTINSAQPQGAVDALVETRQTEQFHWGEEGFANRIEVARRTGQEDMSVQMNLNSGWPIGTADIEMGFLLAYQPHYPEEWRQDPYFWAVEQAQLALDLASSEEQAHVKTAINQQWTDGTTQEIGLGFQARYPEPEQMEGQLFLDMAMDDPVLQDMEQHYAMNLTAQEAPWLQEAWEELWEGEALNPFGELTRQQQEKLSMEINALSLRFTGMLLQTPGMAQVMARINAWYAQQLQAYFQDMETDGAWYPTL